MPLLNIKKITKIILICLVILVFISIFFIYLYYSDLKKTFVLALSNKATSLIGQDVHIKDFSVTPLGTLSFYGIQVRNPKEFKSGDLLYIKEIDIRINMREFFKKRLYFERITVHMPKLTLIKDERGRLNISEQLKNFFKRKPTFEYQINIFTIKNGFFNFNNIQDYKIDNINITLKDISSKAGTKTLLKASSLFLNNNIGLEGWIYLKDDPKKINLTVLSENFTFIPFKKFFEKYKVRVDKTKANAKINIIGNSEEGFNINSDIKVKDIHSIYTRNRINLILVYIKAFLDLRRNTLHIKDCSLLSDKYLAIKSWGRISNLYRNPSYEAGMMIHKLDLSMTNLIKNTTLEGYITSDIIRIKGENINTPPLISGTLSIRDTTINSNVLTLRRLNGNLEFLNNKDNSFKIKGSTEILGVGQYVFQKTPIASFSINIRKRIRQLDVDSSISLPSFQISLRKDRKISVQKIFFKINGVLKDKIFLGKNSLTIDDFSYSGHHMAYLSFSSNLVLRKNYLMMERNDIKIQNASFFTDLIEIKAWQEGIANIKIKNCNAIFKKWNLKFFIPDFSLNVNKKGLNGRFNFFDCKIILSDATSVIMSGHGDFDNERFYILIPNAKVSKGNIKLELKGETRKIFPLKIRAEANDIEISEAYQVFSKFIKIPYKFTGYMEDAKFDGLIISLNDIEGKGLLKARSVFLSEEKKNRNIIKNGILKSEIEFKEKEIYFTTQANIGKISATLSGIVEELLKKDRVITINLTLPNSKISDIRDVFWDIFPDNLLYVDLKGLLSSNLKILYNGNISIEGNVLLKDCIVVGENNEYSIGPINGTIPIAYGKKFLSEAIKIPSFEPSAFDEIKKYYSEDTVIKNYNLVKIDSFSYGFRLLEDINIWLKESGNILNIPYFNGNIFGGKIEGSATIDLTEKLQFKTGFIMSGLSLKKLCDGIEPIKGYLSGKVNGIGNIRGSQNILEIAGKADFWAYSTKDEKTKISKNFLNKIGGPSLKAYIGDRSFDKGIMRLYFMNGYIVFKELEISNKNFLGITDLSIKVAPFNNRISIDDLIWTITETAQRTRSGK